MKKDLTTTIIAAIAGVVAAYFITNMFLPGIENFSFKNLNGNTNFTLAEPDEEIFNYRAVNPTVEVYVGQCMEYDADGVALIMVWVVIVRIVVTMRMATTMRVAATMRMVARKILVK